VTASGQKDTTAATTAGYLDGQESMVEEIKGLEKQLSDMEDQLAELVKG
jgi:hypothetical protein